MPKFEVTWMAPEFLYREKQLSWYWISIIIALVLLSAAVWQRNFLFGFFVVVAEILLIIWSNKTPDTLQFGLSEQGVRVGKKPIHPYSSIATFSIVEQEHYSWHEVIVNFKNRFQPALRIAFPKDKLEAVRKIMSAFTKEVPHEESFLDSVEEIIRF